MISPQIFGFPRFPRTIQKSQNDRSWHSKILQRLKWSSFLCGYAQN
uniref:Uncharacterized protein n=1 Tax=Rhizophora mucronata TaxID=61149 RepID=A0A2P2NJI7_RHIMU